MGQMVFWFRKCSTLMNPVVLKSTVLGLRCELIPVSATQQPGYSHVNIATEQTEMLLGCYELVSVPQNRLQKFKVDQWKGGI